MTVKALMPVRTVNLCTPRLIAAHAHSTGARCQSGYKHLTLGNSFGYTCAKSTAKKAVAGCRSPKARGAEPHPARFAAFLFLATSFGGPNGRAQVLPVTLRVPRSPTPVRAAAQCRSWSAVVHLAQLETIMAQIIAHPRAPAERVIQTRIRGRLPRTVVSLSRVRRDSGIAAYVADQARREVEELRTSLAITERVAHNIRYDIAVKLQKAGKVKP